MNLLITLFKWLSGLYGGDGGHGAGIGAGLMALATLVIGALAILAGIGGAVLWLIF